MEFNDYVRRELETLDAIGEANFTPDLRSVFALVAHVLGPISLREIAAITHTDANLRLLDHRIERWFSVEGDGATRLLSFVHPKIADAFKEALGHEAIDAHSKLLDYAKNWHQPTRLYALNHGIAHLIDSSPSHRDDARNCAAAAALTDMHYHAARLSLPQPGAQLQRSLAQMRILEDLVSTSSSTLRECRASLAAIESIILEIASQSPTDAADLLLQMESDFGPDVWFGKTDARLRLRAVNAPRLDLSIERILKGHTKAVLGALVLADGRILSWSEDEPLRSWLANGTPDRTFDANVVLGAIELGDGRILTWSNVALRLWSSDGSRLGVLKSHLNRIAGALELQSGEILSWSKEGNFFLYFVDGTLKRTWKGHDQSVLGAFELDGGRILSWSGENLRLWNSGGHIERNLVTDDKYVEGAMRLSNATFLSWGGWDKIHFWRADGTLERSVDGIDLVRHASPLDADALVFSDTITSIEDDGTVRTVGRYTDDISTELVVWVLPLEGDRILSSCTDGVLRLWTLSEAKPGRELVGHTDRVNGALALEDGRFVTWSDDDTLRVWCADGSHERVLGGHRSAVSGALALDRGRLLSWSADDTLRLWQIDALPPRGRDGHTDHVLGAIAIDGGRLISWSHDDTQRIWNSDGTLEGVLAPTGLEVRGAKALGAGRFLTWCSSGAPSLWRTNGMREQVFEGTPRSVDGVLELGDGRFLGWSHNKTWHRWRADGTAECIEAPDPYDVWGAISLEGERVLSWFDSKLVLRRSDWTPERVLIGHKDWVQGALSLSGGGILSWSGDDTLHIRGTDGELAQILVGHSGTVWGAIELRAGEILSWSEDRTLRIWRADGVTNTVLAGHGAAVRGALAFGEDRILSWAEDNTVRLWLSNGTQLGIWSTPFGDIHRVIQLHTIRPIFGVCVDHHVIFVRVMP